MAYEVRIIQQPRQDLAVVRKRTTFGEIPTFMGSAFEKVAAYLGPKGLLGPHPAIGRYTEMDMTSGEVVVAAGFVVPQPVEGEGDIVPDETPASEVATTTHLGTYATVSEAYDAIAKAMAVQGRELDETTMWEEYWSPPGTPDDQTKTVVYCPLKAAA
ncbi:GyrI-like domain-containing protein [Agromyces sp. H66]|uniref:GyrI-like domain-containing protein n=1 Tax=Agromyces sp. H66 TaxID=2529859 RepID=UPI0010AA2AAC|nr:GyrI-like domain-containing protein [Agromyces sp. H66]